ncbi:MAG TPA: serine hydrolase domain-containing protein [Pseudoxanthomonas sp.]|nr:serine hydrolase domain-containing protein [Pseudoxanthomonas sp.]
MQFFAKAALLFAFLGGAEAPAQVTATNSSNAAPIDLVGEYIGEDGSSLLVEAAEGHLRLTSGPMTFTLIRQGPGRFTAKERALEFRFTGAKVEVIEQGKVVAAAEKGARPSPAVVYQDMKFGEWADREVPGLLERYRVPAAAIAYIREGRIVFARTYGERRHGVLADPATLFNAASLTKPVAAEVLLRLASQGKLDLDAGMGPVWIDPDLAGNERAARLTTRMSLEHRTGLPNWRSQTANTLTFQFPPGDGFHYSGEGYTYAARYAEALTGTSFEQLANELVFQPLEMHDVSFTAQESYKRHAAYPHDALGRELWPVLRLDYSAACCLYTTINDYARFVVGVMHDTALSSTLQAQRIATGKNQAREMCDEGEGLSRELCPPRIAMGLGWFVFGYPEQTVVHHTGTNDGERSLALFVPETGLGLVILTNGANGRKLIKDVSAAAYDNPAFNRILESQAR